MLTTYHPSLLVLCYKCIVNHYVKGGDGVELKTNHGITRVWLNSRRLLQKSSAQFSFFFFFTTICTLSNFSLLSALGINVFIFVSELLTHLIKTPHFLRVSEIWTKKQISKPTNCLPYRREKWQFIVFYLYSQL